MRRNFPRLCLLPFRSILIAFLFAALLSAQSDTAGLFGLVRDSSGGAVVGCKVRLQNSATGSVREQLSDGKGLYQFELLPPGEYELTVEAAGFKQFRDSRVRVNVAQISRLNAQLEVGSASEFVEVQDTVSPLNTETVSQGTIIGQQKIVQLLFEDAFLNEMATAGLIDYDGATISLAASA